ncbi:FtsX-like permease family protein [Lacticaseibacillus kribbianus]|uniref:FtsX-like permease family protein n=1 Tax=Lacticaseibacillus kribbianus TaxID=2926292 RepID=UPI001CD5BE14|nr:FtsX-like permease family protein [Lacticaseibacillus kribbianus]
MRQLISRDLRRHATTTVLFALMGGAIIAVLYAVLAMTENVALMAKLDAGALTPDMVPAFLVVTVVVILIFTIVFLLYMNAILVARRDREIGVYRLLGLSARRIGVSLIVQALIQGAAAIGVGLVLGVLLSKFFVMGLVRLMGLRIVSGLLWSPRAALELTALFLLVYLVLGAINALYVTASPLRRPLWRVGQDTTLAPLSGWRVVWAILGLLLLGGAYVRAYNLIPWTFRLDSGAAMAALWGGIILAGLIGTYLMFRTTLPVLMIALSRTRLRLSAGALLTVVDLRKRLRTNSQSLFLTTMLATLTMTVLGSGAMLYQFSQQTVRQSIAMDAVVSAHGQKSFMAGVKPAWVRGHVALETKLVAGELDSVNVDATTNDFTIYNVMAQSSYNAMRRRDATLPARAPLEDDQALMVVYGRALLQNTWMRQRDDWWVRLPRTKTRLSVVQTTSRYPLGADAYFDRALVVSNRTYAKLKAPLDVLHGYTLGSAQAVGRYLTSLDNQDTEDYVSFGKAALAGKTALRVSKTAQARAQLSRSAVNLRRPMVKVMNATFGLGLFIAVLTGFVFLLATASILLMKQLLVKTQTESDAVTLSQLGMPDAVLRRVLWQETLAVFALPLVFGTVNTGLVVRLIGIMLDDPGVGTVVLVIAVFAAVYLAFAALTVRLALAASARSR